MSRILFLVSIAALVSVVIRQMDAASDNQRKTGSVPLHFFVICYVLILRVFVFGLNFVNVIQDPSSLELKLVRWYVALPTSLSFWFI